MFEFVAASSFKVITNSAILIIIHHQLSTDYFAKEELLLGAFTLCVEKEWFFIPPSLLVDNLFTEPYLLM